MPVVKGRSPSDTQHTLASDWPLVLAVGTRGDSVHTCADCGAVIEDGTVVERDTRTGRVHAWKFAGTDGQGQPVKTDAHTCAGRPPANG